MRVSLARRNFLKRASTGLALASASRLSAEESNPVRRPLIIDCHAHIYGTDEKRYPTIEKPYRPPAGKGTLGHLKAEMKAAGVGYVTAIQTSTYYRWDNRFTADSARRNHEFMAGVVTLDPDDPASPGKLKQYVRDDNVRGMRSIPAKSGRLDDPGVSRLWKMAEALGIVINVLVGRQHRAQIETLAGRHPRLRIVIDHCLNLQVGPTLEATLADVLALAKIPRAHAKLTFLPTGTKAAYPCMALHQACLQVIDAFGPNRCIWGSDFPCELWCPQITYADHLRIFSEALELDSAARTAILGKTAYGLWFQTGD